VCSTSGSRAIIERVSHVALTHIIAENRGTLAVRRASLRTRACNCVGVCACVCQMCCMHESLITYRDRSNDLDRDTSRAIGSAPSSLTHASTTDTLASALLQTAIIGTACSIRSRDTHRYPSHLLIRSWHNSMCMCVREIWRTTDAWISPTKVRVAREQVADVASIQREAELLTQRVLHRGVLRAARVHCVGILARTQVRGM